MKAVFNDQEWKDVLDQVQSDSNWNQGELVENIRLMMYGGEKDGAIYGYQCAVEAGIPEVTEGYWLFYDRYEGAVDPYDDTQLFGRYSFNFSFALLDVENHCFYYYETDT